MNRLILICLLFSSVGFIARCGTPGVFYVQTGDQKNPEHLTRIRLDSGMAISKIDGQSVGVLGAGFKSGSIYVLPGEHKADIWFELPNYQPITGLEITFVAEPDTTLFICNGLRRSADEEITAISDLKGRAVKPFTEQIPNSEVIVHYNEFGGEVIGAVENNVCINP